MLDKELREYQNKHIYPFHMPGHKRNVRGWENPYAIDITEIEGFDNLHKPEGQIREAMDELRCLYNSKKSYLLINGSTCGNLAAVFAATKPGDKLIIGRGCHKSVYHAAELRRLSLVYLYPQVTEQGIARGTELLHYKKVLEENADARAVVITSPTYEGFLEPLGEMVELAHRYGMAVIVDAAHGAHLGFHPFFPPSPMESGADIVVMSLHKTLPALTQTAVLHINKQAGISEEAIEKYLSVFQTSSPSYVLMSSICECIRFLQSGGEEFSDYAKYLDDFYKKCEALKHLRVKKYAGHDDGKLILDTFGTDISGRRLSEMLRRDYKLEPEMSSFYYALAMTSVKDTQEGFDRLAAALLQIDGGCRQNEPAAGDVFDFYGGGRKAMELYEAADRKKETVSLSRAVCKVAADTICIYPPAVPLVVAGEYIIKGQARLIENAVRSGLQVTGIIGKNKDGIAVSVVN